MVNQLFDEFSRLPQIEAIALGGSRSNLVSIWLRTTAFMESYFDILWTLSENTHPGEKWLIRCATRSAGSSPHRFEENLETFYSHLFTGPQKFTDDLQAIIDELTKNLRYPLAILHHPWYNVHSYCTWRQVMSHFFFAAYFSYYYFFGDKK